jgi:hypothetical protein
MRAALSNPRPNRVLRGRRRSRRRHHVFDKHVCGVAPRLRLPGIAPGLYGVGCLYNLAIEGDGRDRADCLSERWRWRGAVRAGSDRPDDTTGNKGATDDGDERL